MVKKVIGIYLTHGHLKLYFIKVGRTGLTTELIIIVHFRVFKGKHTDYPLDVFGYDMNVVISHEMDSRLKLIFSNPNVLVFFTCYSMYPKRQSITCTLKGNLSKL